jgi:hypothetical protein
MQTPFNVVVRSTAVWRAAADVDPVASSSSARWSTKAR